MKFLWWAAWDTYKQYERLTEIRIEFEISRCKTFHKCDIIRIFWTSLMHVCTVHAWMIWCDIHKQLQRNKFFTHIHTNARACKHTNPNQFDCGLSEIEARNHLQITRAKNNPFLYLMKERKNVPKSWTLFYRTLDKTLTYEITINLTMKMPINSSIICIHIPIVYVANNLNENC